MVVFEGLRLTVAGIALGAAAAYPSAQAMKGAIHGVESPGAWLYSAVAVVLILVAVVASYVPARSAASLDTATALNRKY